MNIQLPPNSRASDPESSHIAGESIANSGVRLTQCERVLQAVRLREGMTAREIALARGLDRYMVSRRLADLETKGLVAKGRMRKCIDGKRMSVTWVLS